jgi:hypothetical protein
MREQRAGLCLDEVQSRTLLVDHTLTFQRRNRTLMVTFTDEREKENVPDLGIANETAAAIESAKQSGAQNWLGHDRSVTPAPVTPIHAQPAAAVAERNGTHH